MTVDELKEMCAIDGFDWAEGDCPEGEQKGKPGFFIRAPRFDKDGEDNPVAHVTIEALPTTGWPAIKRFALAGRDVSQITRVVGYYSRVSNWNASKVGELRDRHKGNYGVENTPA